MALLSFDEAAKCCGYRSRSQLYSLKEAGRLDPYLRPGGKRGAQQLETEPPGHPPLVQFVHSIKASKHSRNPVAPPSAAEGDKGLDRDQLRQMVAQLSDVELMDGVESRKRRDHFAAIREEWVAELARLDAKERNGELVSAAEVRKEMFQMCRSMRDNLLGVAARVSGRVAASSDVREVQVLIEEEIRTALRVLSDG